MMGKLLPYINCIKLFVMFTISLRALVVRLF